MIGDLVVERGCFGRVFFMRHLGWAIGILQAGNLIFCVHMGDLVMGERCHAGTVGGSVEQSWMSIVCSELV